MKMSLPSLSENSWMVTIKKKLFSRSEFSISLLESKTTEIMKYYTTEVKAVEVFSAIISFSFTTAVN